MIPFQDIFTCEPVPEDPSSAIHDDEIEMPSPIAPGAGCNESQSSYLKTARETARDFLNGAARLCKTGAQFWKIVCKKSPKELVNEFLQSSQMPIGSKGSNHPRVSSRITLPDKSAFDNFNQGFPSIQGFSQFAPIAPTLVTQGMLLLNLVMIRELQNEIHEIADRYFRDQVHDLNGARKTAEKALLSFVKANHKGFVDAAYTTLSTQFSSFCGKMNDIILGTNPEDEWAIIAAIRAADHWDKTCNSMILGVKALVDAFRMSSDLCLIIDPVVAYTDRVENLKELKQIDFRRLGDILHYVNAQKFKNAENYVSDLPQKISDLLDAQEKKPVFLLSSDDLSQLTQKEFIHG